MLKERSDKKLKGCLIFDDLMEELSECGVLTKLFTKFSTHYGVSIINIKQNLFHPGNGQIRPHLRLSQHLCAGHLQQPHGQFHFDYSQ